MDTDPPRATFLPDFCSIRLTFTAVLTAELLALVLSLAADNPADAFWNDLSLRSLYVQWIVLSCVALLCLLNGRLGPRLRHWSDGRVGLAAWLLILLVTLAVALISRYLMRDDQPLPFILRSLGISAVVGAMVLQYLYVQHQLAQQALAESRARYDALQARIRPHFLFNSMNTIANLTRDDPPLAEEVVQDLSDLFRASLARPGRRSTLGEELELARGYLHIESFRLGERLRVQWDLQPLPEQAPMPPLVLQPLLENAVYHGIEPAAEGGDIVISGRFRRGTVNLSIRNSRPLQGQPVRVGNRIALDNTRARLQAFFDGAGQLTVGEVEGDYQVRISFPYDGPAA